MTANYKLNQAVNKIDRDTLDNMERGETIVLNERYNLYSYDDMDYYVIVDTDESVNDETICVQYADYQDKSNKDVVFTDFYGYE